MTWTMFFTVVGVCAVSNALMDFITWLDTPKGGKAHG